MEDGPGRSDTTWWLVDGEGLYQILSGWGVLVKMT